MFYFVDGNASSWRSELKTLCKEVFAVANCQTSERVAKDGHSFSYPQGSAKNFAMTMPFCVKLTAYIVKLKACGVLLTTPIPPSSPFLQLKISRL